MTFLGYVTELCYFPAVGIIESGLSCEGGYERCVTIGANAYFQERLGKAKKIPSA
jgi:hypothetical protein